MKRTRRGEKSPGKKSEETSDEILGVEEVEGKVDDDDDDVNNMDDEGDDDDIDDDEDEDEAEGEPSSTSTFTPNSSNNSSPFLDSFYGLSAPLAADRARAAHTLVRHCLLDASTANAADAAYAYKRLWRGLSSGRAAARQGNAAALASFLKIAFFLPVSSPNTTSEDTNGISASTAPSSSTTRMTEIRAAYTVSLKSLSAHQRQEYADLSDWAFVRHCLLTETEPPSLSLEENKNNAKGRGGGVGNNSNKRKGSEERDYQFGRLFGINGIVRSGILLLGGKEQQQPNNEAEIQSVTTQLMSDLVELYQTKKWIREPASHAICTLLSTLTEGPDGTRSAGTISSSSSSIAHHVVETVVIPQLLRHGDRQEQNNTPVDSKSNKQNSQWSSYSAEQVGIALFVQSTMMTTGGGKFSAPLNKPVFTTETLPFMAAALSETSVVIQPRTHLVWDAFWYCITESMPTSASTSVDVRKIRSQCANSNNDDSVQNVPDLVRAVLHHVVGERLLGLETKEASTGSKDASSQNHGKTTHERRALALCIVRNMMGVEFVSSLSGRTRVLLGPETIQSIVLDQLFVKRLFLDVICAGTNRRSTKQSAHMLKPLALQILSQASETLMVVPRDKVLADKAMQTRLGMALAFLKCDPRFDSRTKTNTVETLLGVVVGAEVTTDLITSIWEPYSSFLQERIAGIEPASQANPSSSYEAQGFLDLLFHLGKRLIRLDLQLTENVLSQKDNAIRRILGFLMAIAFFDVSSCETVAPPSSSKKKKKEKSRDIVRNHDNVAVETAIFVKKCRAGKPSTLPYDVRVVASARFFSLVTDCVSVTTHSSIAKKESVIQTLLSELWEMQHALTGSGAKALSNSTPSDEMDTDDESSEVIVIRLQKEAKGGNLLDNNSTTRWLNGCTMLASTLHLHLLSCGLTGADNTGNDDPDADDEEDAEEIHGLLSDLSHVSSLFSKKSSESENPLLSLAEICVNVLSSPLGAGNQCRGASPTLLREIVKFAWTGGLSLSGTDSDVSILSPRVVNVLLNSIGAIDDTVQDGEEEGDDEVDEDDDDDDDEDPGSDDAMPLSFTAGDADALEKEFSEDEKDSQEDQDGDNELTLDSLKLQTMLEEGSDADVDEGELEHHEGADAALAKLIQLKQDARKAGQLARERAEIARQLRCILLLETLVVGKVDTWGHLLGVDTIMLMTIPLLQYRKDLFKSLSKANVKTTTAGSSEKKALLERITSLLKTKILKVKLPDSKSLDSAKDLESIQEHASCLVQLAKEADDKEQQALCSSGLMLLLRSILDSTSKIKLTELYTDVVSEWATKRTTRLDTTLFERLINHYPVLAQASLSSPLASAAANGRSSFLQSESFRLLTLLYNTKLNPNVSELDRLATDRVVSVAEEVLAAIASCLKDSEMSKTKRVREVLKTADRVVAFLNVSCDRASALSLSYLSEIKLLLVKLETDSESKGINNSAESLSLAIDDLLKQNSLKDESNNRADINTAASITSNEPESTVKKVKTKSKRKKK